MRSFLKDTLIITNPAINDIPKFSAIAGSVIYVIDHSERGAVGISLNKCYAKSFAEIAETVPPFGMVNEDFLLSPTVIAGGPLYPDMPWILGRNPNTFEKSINVGVLTLNFSEQAFANNQEDYMSVCGLGTFGWGADQLENEIANFMWHLIPSTKEALESIPFGEDVLGAAQILSALKFT